ncbi:MAG: universal stress protein, partial [Anaerolineales bacterium]|nr:universal stress protein [Anaerolineales bacterium]
MTKYAQHKANYNTAVQDFKQARKQAAMQQLIARLTGKSVELLSYEEVHEQFPSIDKVEKGVQEIPLDAIVGSVGRYEDFTRTFLPKHDGNEERWARVKTAVLDMKGWPPIDVYQVGEAYFVLDGNHRVSVARQLGSESITARVTEVKTRVPLTLDDDPNEVICKAQYASFLEETNLDRVCPDCDLQMTFTGQYRVLKAQIAAHRRWLESQRGESASEQEAVISWHENVYMPVVKMIREQGILHHFSNRTETDIYILLEQHQEELEEALDWEIDMETAVYDLAEQESQRRERGIVRLGKRLLHAIVPAEFTDGPAPGHWRKRQLEEGRENRLFADYLVAFRGVESDWDMLDQVIGMAQLDHDRLLGLHVVPRAADKEGAQAKQICERFEAYCKAHGVVGEMAIESGNITDAILRRAAWADLVVISLQYPPVDQPLARLGSGLIKLVQRCPQPILTLPIGSKILMDRVLLAYDGSPKADEALYVATYLKSRWPLDLTVLTVETEHTTSAALARARRYIEAHGIQDATYVLRERPIAEAVLETAVAYNNNYLIMGGFGFRPVKHIVLGSTVERVLSEFRYPVLICR